MNPIVGPTNAATIIGIVIEDPASDHGRIDLVLLPFLDAADEAEANNLLTGLVCDYAQPIIKAVITSTLRTASTALNTQVQDCEDVAGEVILKLVKRLQEFRSDPAAAPADFRGYIAVAAYNACYGYLRRRYPVRHRLKQRLRRLLSERADFALWTDEAGVWLCGLSEWQTSGRRRAGSERIWSLRDDSEAAFALDGDLSRRLSSDSLASVLKLLGGPVAIDELVALLLDVTGVKDESASLGFEDGEPPSLPSSILMETGHAARVEQRIYLERLWEEVVRLPLGQRTALLLGLKDPKGRDLLTVLTVVRIASQSQIAEALGMSMEEFSELWNSLPIEDASIAGRLGLTRQQVVNLRVSARRRLARRLGAFRS